MSTDPGSNRSMLADIGLVSMVVGGGASLVLGIACLLLAALLGYIPVVIGFLFVLAALVTVFGLVVTIVTTRREKATPTEGPTRTGL